MAHPFLVNQFLITQPSEIDKVRAHGIRQVSIDTARGLDVAPVAADSALGLDLELDLPAPAAPDVAPVPSRPLREELAAARVVLAEASALMNDVMADVRMGRMVELERMQPVVENIVQSVLRNPGALSCLGRMRQKDHYTFAHSVNVSVLLVNFCHHMGLDRRSIHAAAIGGLLHDVGKVNIPDAILNKAGPLNDAEFALIRTHVDQGVDIAAAIAGISDLSLTVVAQHHEHADGSGYPVGLKGNQIAPLGQMAAIVDVYEALTSDRAYRPAIEPSQALQNIYAWSTQQFNPELVQRFIQCVGIYPVGTLVLLDSGMVAIVTEANRSNLLRPVVRVVLDSRRDQIVTPRDLNLARPTVKERIVSSESAAKWKINVGLYL